MLDALRVIFQSASKSGYSTKPARKTVDTTTRLPTGLSSTDWFLLQAFMWGEMFWPSRLLIDVCCENGMCGRNLGGIGTSVRRCQVCQKALCEYCLVKCKACGKRHFCRSHSQLPTLVCENTGIYVNGPMLMIIPAVFPSSPMVWNNPLFFFDF